jgi:hypothetical protein
VWEWKEKSKETRIKKQEARLKIKRLEDWKINSGVRGQGILESANLQIFELI